MRAIFVFKEILEENQVGILKSIPFMGSPLSFELRVSQVTQYLTQQEVGSLLSISERTVRNRSRKGVLRAYRFGTRVFYKRTEVAQQLVTSKSLKP